MARLIKEIAQEIREKWTKVSPYAEPYLKAMMELNTIDDHYYLDTAEEVVLYFLCNAGSFRGRRCKKT